MNRVLVGTSHEGRIEYWLDDRDRYIYQRRKPDGTWIGWICSLDAWERTFSKSAWITLVAV